LVIFGKKSEGESNPASNRDPRKAKRFFDHAKVVSDSRNFDYAIECYINGLQHDPDNIAVHEMLWETAIQRKAAGGKVARLKEKFKATGKDTIDKLLHIEMIWAKDPVNISLMADVMSRAVEAHRAHEELDFTPLAQWVGRLLLESRKPAKGQTKATVYIKATELFSQINAFSEAVEACTMALRLDPENSSLAKRLKDLEAEQTMQQGGYTPENIRSGNFRGMVKNLDQQRQLERNDAITVRGSALVQEIQCRRDEHNEAPQDIDKLGKLVAVLVRTEEESAENEAVGLLERALELTGQYRYKMRIGDIRMKQINRRLNKLQSSAKTHPDDATIRDRIQTLHQQKLNFELGEYTERVKTYPTDSAMRFELGRRLFAFQKYDAAIAAFQQAKIDPKHRIVSMDYLGRCYGAMEWFEEAVDTLRQAIEAHPAADDHLGLELRYQLMLSLKQLAIKETSTDLAKEAQKIASQVLQTDINFRDIRQQMDGIRKLVDDLAKR